MFVLGNGKSTGKIVKSVSSNGVIISATHYPIEGCGHVVFQRSLKEIKIIEL